MRIINTVVYHSFRLLTTEVDTIMEGCTLLFKAGMIPFHKFSSLRQAKEKEKGDHMDTQHGSSRAQHE